MNKGAIHIEVSLSDTFDEFLISKEQAQAMTEAALFDVTQSFMFAWKAEAKLVLGSTRQNYINSIKMIDKGKLEKAVVLIGEFNNMLELGCPPFDMKPGFEKSSKKKISASGGWYLTIPFRFATPGALGESDAFSGTMPDEIYAAAKGKSLKSAVWDKNGSNFKSNPITIEDIPKSLQTIGTRKQVGNFGAYEHKNNIYEGIQRNETTYENATQYTYTSFRRVSNKSNPLAWIHAGIKAYDLANKALTGMDVETIVDNAIDQFISGNSIQKR